MMILSISIQTDTILSDYSEKNRQLCSATYLHSEYGIFLHLLKSTFMPSSVL